MLNLLETHKLSIPPNISTDLLKHIPCDKMKMYCSFVNKHVFYFWKVFIDHMISTPSDNLTLYIGGVLVFTLKYQVSVQYCTSIIFQLLQITSVE